MMKGFKTKGDLLLLIAVVAIALFGLLMIYSSSSYSANSDYGDSFFYVKKQAVGLVIGIAAMISLSKVNFNLLKKLKWAALAVSIIMLALVFIPGLGVEKYGAKRWIGFFGKTLQPSEISKIGFVIFAAGYIADYPERMKKFLGMLPVLLAGCAICVLIILEPNMSITICMGAVMLVMLFVGGVKMRHMCFILVPAILVVPVLILIEPYRLNRLSAFLNPWASPKGEGYQLLQSLYALGSGGWFGVGLFNSRQKFKFLPFAESDFILSVIGEELGFVGLLILFLIFLFIIYRGYRAAVRAENMFGFMLAVGITSIFGIQVLINALVVTGSIPPTGLPLPLISSGNTSLIMFMSAMGILYNISAGGDKQIKFLKRK